MKRMVDEKTIKLPLKVYFEDDELCFELDEKYKKLLTGIDICKNNFIFVKGLDTSVVPPVPFKGEYSFSALTISNDLKGEISSIEREVPVGTNYISSVTIALNNEEVENNEILIILENQDQTFSYEECYIILTLNNESPRMRVEV